jgi:hypothetical protein
LGPSNPGVVFVANPTEDWQYPLLKAASLDLVNLGGYFVTTTGVQSVDGEKTFTTAPKVPTATLTSGLQVVNIDRLNSDLSANNATLNTAITGVATSVSTLSANITANYMSLSGTQTVTGAKTFNDIAVPLNPGAPNNPVSLQHYDNNTVKLAGDQTIAGEKTFSVSPQVPNPNSINDAVNYQTLQAMIGQITNPQVSQNCIKLGNIQIIFGSTPILGNWGAVGPLTTGPVNYNSVAPGMSPFQSIAGGSATCDRTVVVGAIFNNNDVIFNADESPPGVPANGTIKWVVFGYI